MRGALSLLTLAIILGSSCVAGSPIEDTEAAYSEAAVKLKQGMRDEGYWVGDVTELHRLGVISRELAEADAAPRRPLVSSPRMFNGYFVRAMNSGPATDKDWAPVLLKGKTWSKETFAICVYPATKSSIRRPLYLVCPLGIFEADTQGGEALLEWPKDIREGGGAEWIEYTLAARVDDKILSDQQGTIRQGRTICATGFHKNPS